MNLLPSLPDPDQATLERSQQLEDMLRHDIAESSHGCIGFDHFMQRALYEPALGYYASEHPIFGPDGDFVTAPESGDLFNACVAGWVQNSMSASDTHIVEYGAGSGRLAVTVVRQLMAGDEDAPWRYHIVEPSESLRVRQQALFAEELPMADERIVWHSDHPGEEVCGLIIANEVIDAMPAKRWQVEDGEFSELAVGCRETGFCWQPLSAVTAPESLQRLAGQLGDGYVSETIPMLGSWLAAIKSRLRTGVILIVDYGYPRHEFLHQSRTDGTLKCHYRHHVHDNPFWLPGGQDITTSVDFSTLAELALDVGFEVAGFTTQANFLIENDLETIMANASGGDASRQYALAQHAKRLLLPGEMGEVIKVMMLATGDHPGIAEFRNDQTHRLGGYDTGASK